LGHVSNFYAHPNVLELAEKMDYQRNMLSINLICDDVYFTHFILYY
jgi:adenine deaminase